jgi:chromosomal replication initiation ATPase DnaA
MTPEIYTGLFKKNIPIGKLTKATILKAVCLELEMDFEEVKNRKTRLKEFVYARHLYAYFCKKFTNDSLTSIGKYINKDHATIIHSNTQISNWITCDEKVKLIYEILNNQFKHKIVNFTENQREKISKGIILKYAN